MPLAHVLVLGSIDDPARFTPSWGVTKGEGIVSVSEDGTITALSPGDATVEAKIPGLAARSGFLFIKALGQVGFHSHDESAFAVGPTQDEQPE